MLAPRRELGAALLAVPDIGHAARLTRRTDGLRVRPGWRDSPSLSHFLFTYESVLSHLSRLPSAAPAMAAVSGPERCGRAHDQDGATPKGCEWLETRSTDLIAALDEVSLSRFRLLAEPMRAAVLS